MKGKPRNIHVNINHALACRKEIYLRVIRWLDYTWWYWEIKYMYFNWALEIEKHWDIFSRNLMLPGMDFLLISEKLWLLWWELKKNRFYSRLSVIKFNQLCVKFHWPSNFYDHFPIPPQLFFQTFFSPKSIWGIYYIVHLTIQSVLG